MPAITQFIQPEDFILRYKLSVGFKDGNALIEQYIKMYEKPYMYRLFGQELCDLIYLNYDAEAIYQALAEPTVTTYCDEVYTSTGFIDIISSFIYSHYVRENINTNTSIGQMAASIEAGTPANDNNTVAFAFYNAAARNALALQKYVEVNKADYPEYLGTHIQTTWVI